MAFGLFIALDPVLAEFEIQEAGIEKGEVELEYRGAVHWGFPNAERGEADEGGALDTEEAEASLRQSHDFEAEWGVTNWWLLADHSWYRAAFGGRLQSDLGRA